MNSVLVDTSVWIDLLRVGNFSKDIRHLSALGMLATCGLVKTEIIPFSGRDKAKITAYFSDIIYLPFDDTDWAQLQNLQEHYLRKFGHSCGIPDLIVICTAKKHSAKLFSKDKTMNRIASVLGVGLFHPYAKATQPPLR